MRLMSHVLALVLLAPCFASGCIEERFGAEEARSRGEVIFADFLKSLKEDHDSHLERADFGEPVVALQDDFGASIAFSRLDRPYQDPVYVLINWNGCISISGTP